MEYLKILAVVISSGGLLVAALSVRMALRVQERQFVFQQRQQIFQLWGHITSIAEIDPLKPVVLDVIKGMNSLELVATCWEQNLIDRDVIRRVFGPQFVKWVGSLEAVQSVNLGSETLSGRQILHKSPSVSKVYDELRNEQINAGSIKPMKGA